MVVDHHDHFRPDLRPGPRVVAPGLAQTVTADMPREPQLFCRAADNPPGLNPADGLLVAPVVREEILPPMPREVDREGVKRLPVQGDAARFAGFPLDHDKVVPETAVFKPKLNKEVYYTSMEEKQSWGRPSAARMSF